MPGEHVNITIIALATIATILRVLLLILIAIVTGWILAYISKKSRTFENIYVPLVNVFESIPVIGFLPIVLIVFIAGIGGPLGVELAADFLVFDAVAWNVWIGIYQAFKTVPENLLEVSDNYRFGTLGTLTKLYIPHSIPRITSNMFSSFADAFFYISVSEVFTVGVTTYQTFGIGTLIAQFLKQGNMIDIYYSLLFIAIGVVGITLAFSRLSRWAVAKYGVDTAYEIKRNKSWLRTNLYHSYGTISTRVKSLARRAMGKGQEKEEPEIAKSRRLFKFIGFLLLAAVLAYLLYSFYLIASSVSAEQWRTYLSETPFLLYSMGVDYVRVAIVTLVSLALAITLGYFLAVHYRLSSTVAPAIQAFAAFPAPTYFPLVFLFTLPFVENLFPFFYAEIYILILGFLSCFYYVFFDFWIAVQAIPVEFWDVMRNHELSFFARMKRIIIPAAFPYLITGISSTINSAWAGIAIGEFWPNIYDGHSLLANVGMMKFIGFNLAKGDIGSAAWVSLIFAVVVFVYGLVFTRRLMDIARKRYVVEEGVYAA
jgi:NitT/TauT family transport system permease protein